MNKQSTELKFELTFLYIQTSCNSQNANYCGLFFRVSKRLNREVCEIHFRQKFLSFLPGFLPLLLLELPASSIS